jgi:hypothetical protein
MPDEPIWEIGMRRLLSILSLAGAVIAAPPPASYGRIPLHFEPNLGQFHGGGQWTARAAGLTAAIEGSRMRLKLAAAGVVTMHFQGAAADPVFEPEGRLPGVSNYYYGNDPLHWRTGVPHYARIRAKGVYPGIDVVYYGAGSDLEYDFIVAPGADPERIQLTWSGVDELRMDPPSGDLVLVTAGGELRQPKPRVYQEVAGRRVEITAEYRVRGAAAGFELAEYASAGNRSGHCLRSIIRRRVS